MDQPDTEIWRDVHSPDRNSAPNATENDGGDGGSTRDIMMGETQAFADSVDDDTQATHDDRASLEIRGQGGSSSK